MEPEDHSERDEELLDDLRRAVTAFDPVPAHLVDAAESALDWRTIDDELAALLNDSSAEPELAGVRSGDTGRLLSFAGANVRIEVEVSGSGPARTLTGQLVPAGSARIEIRHADRVMTVTADPRGRFSAADVPAGSVSLRCLLDAPGHPQAVATPWLPI
jgi:hypothetical protein